MLTGNTRHRNGMFGRLILQVEERRTDIDRYDLEERQFTIWRDAKVEDLCALAPTA